MDTNPLNKLKNLILKLEDIAEWAYDQEGIEMFREAVDELRPLFIEVSEYIVELEAEIIELGD